MQPPTNKHTNRSRSWLISTLIFTVFAVIVFGVGVNQRRAIADWVQLRNYQAPADIEKMANYDTMTDKARRIFYVNKPIVEERAAFAKSCPSGEQEKTIVLGCYKSDQAGIFLLNVTDERLSGVKRVTAAHEMLHAAYDRLSSSDRQAIDAQLMAYYKNGLTDERIKTTIDAYKKSEPNDVVNEMHSIFATEIVQLPQGLEEYYAQYFTKRSVVADLSARYQAEFTSRRNQVKDDDARLKTLKENIESQEAKLKTLQTQISDREQSLTSLRNSNSISEYNAGVPAYNALISSYNAQVDGVKSLVTTYNALVAKRNATALEEDQLIKSLSAESQTINN